MKRSNAGSTTLLQKLLSNGYLYESVAVIGAPSWSKVTPLGTRAAGPVLIAKAYPGTTLARLARGAVWACIAYPCSAKPIYEALQGMPPLRPARTLPINCPRIGEGEAAAVVEAVVERRRRWLEDGCTLYLKPVHVEKLGCSRPYTRADGCLVEAMIAYTRAVYWARKRPHGCRLAAQYYRQIVSLMTGCVNRTAPRGSWERDAAQTLAAQALRLLALNGCHPSLDP